MNLLDFMDFFNENGGFYLSSSNGRNEREERHDTELPQGFDSLEKFFAYCEEQSQREMPEFTEDQLVFLYEFAGVLNCDFSEYETTTSKYGIRYIVPPRRVRKMLNAIMIKG